MQFKMVVGQTVLGVWMGKFFSSIIVNIFSPFKQNVEDEGQQSRDSIRRGKLGDIVVSLIIPFYPKKCILRVID